MVKIKNITRKTDTTFVVELDQEIWDSFSKTERTTFLVYANDELEAYNTTMKGIWHEQRRTW